MSPTNISWVAVPGYKPEVWNPVVGCTPAAGSEKGGCLNCYARVLHDRRHAANKAARDLRARYPESGVKSPFPPQYDRPFAKVQLLEDRLDVPLRWRKPRSIFVDSMSDLFHDDVPDEFRDRVFAAMALTPQHLYQVLTKRPERMREWFAGVLADDEEQGYRADRINHAMRTFDLWPDISEEGFATHGIWPLPNVWLGVSVEDQERLGDRYPLLADTPAAVRFLSLEPLLGPILFDRVMVHPAADARWLHGIHWVIVGGESGPGHRDMDLAWVQSIRDQCAASGVAFFGKQRSGPRANLPLPDDLAIHEWPERPS